MSSCLRHTQLSPSFLSILAEGSHIYIHTQRLISSQTTAACSPSFPLLSAYYVVFSGWHLSELRFDPSLHTSQQASRCFQIASSLLAPWRTLTFVVHPCDTHLGSLRAGTSGSREQPCKTQWLPPAWADLTMQSEWRSQLLSIVTLSAQIILHWKLYHFSSARPGFGLCQL